MPSSRSWGRYRITPRTVRRPPKARFEPRYELSAEVLDDLRRVERADQELRRHHLDAAAARRLLEEALAKNAYGTASIEGNPLSLEDVTTLLARGPTPAALRRPDEREILNYAAFIEQLGAIPPPREPDDVRGLHRVLFAGVLEDAGAFKQRPNFIGRRPAFEVTFIPAPPRRVVPELRRALAWLHDAAEPPLVKAEVFFHEFESIHPFRDGNGRCGRALTTLLLHHFGYPGVRYALVDYRFNEDRDPYYAHLAAADREGDFTTWVAYMSRILRETFEEAAARFVLRRELPAELSSDQARIAEWFGRLARAQPEARVAASTVQEAFPTVSDRTLRRMLGALVDAGVLEREGERKGTRYRLDARYAARRNRSIREPL